MSSFAAGLARFVLGAIVAGWPTVLPPDDDASDDGSFGMTEPIACREINGYEDYVVLPNAALTADEKLLVYFRPRHFKSVRVGGEFETHLTQDGRVRRRGEKAVLWSKMRMLDYKVRTPEPPRLISLRDTVALKGLKPGDYEFEIVLHDEIGKSAPAVRVLLFRVLPSPVPHDPAPREVSPRPSTTASERQGR